MFRIPPLMRSVRPTSPALSSSSTDMWVQIITAPTTYRYHAVSASRPNPPRSDLTTPHLSPPCSCSGARPPGHRRYPPLPLPRRWRSPVGNTCCCSSHETSGSTSHHRRSDKGARGVPRGLFPEPDIFTVGPISDGQQDKSFEADVGRGWGAKPDGGGRRRTPWSGNPDGPSRRPSRTWIGGAGTTPPTCSTRSSSSGTFLNLHQCAVVNCSLASCVASTSNGYQNRSCFHPHQSYPQQRTC
jgi:hypothetical protein